MPRELPTYRDNLEHLDKLFPSKELFTRPDIEKLTGLSHSTVPKEFSFSGRYISKVNLAHRLAQLGGDAL